MIENILSYFNNKYIIYNDNIIQNELPKLTKLTKLTTLTKLNNLNKYDYEIINISN
jgi:hypothetical protein